MSKKRERANRSPDDSSRAGRNDPGESGPTRKPAHSREARQDEGDPYKNVPNADDRRRDEEQQRE